MARKTINTNISGSYSTVSTISSSSSLVWAPTSTATNVLTSPRKSTYHVLGEDIETDYSDINIAIVISSINILGIQYYGELLRQGITFNGNLCIFLDRKLLEYQRDNKIDQVIK